MSASTGRVAPHGRYGWASKELMVGQRTTVNSPWAEARFNLGCDRGTASSTNNNNYTIDSRLEQVLEVCEVAFPLLV